MRKTHSKMSANSSIFFWPQSVDTHYTDVTMCAIASQITSLTIVYSTVYSGADQRKHQSSALLAFVGGNSPGTGEFPAQMASNTENVSVWWRHHVYPHVHTYPASVLVDRLPIAGGKSKSVGTAWPNQIHLHYAPMWHPGVSSWQPNRG